MVGRLILLVLGASNGISVWTVDDDGFHVIENGMKIPWKYSNGATYWPVEWFQAFLRDKILALAGQGDTIGGLMWGADLVVTTQTDRTEIAAPLHYPCLAGVGVKEEALRRMPELEIYRRTGGANVDFYQPYCQLLGYDHFHPGILPHVVSVELMADWITLQLSGVQGHDRVMLQDQGLSPESDGARVCEEVTGVPASVFPGSAFPDNKVIKRDDGIGVVPISHDSVPARMAGYAASKQGHPVVNWTGTWLGTAVYLGDRKPKLDEEMMEARIAIEGAGRSASAIINSARIGQLYRALKEQVGISFDEAAREAHSRLRHVSSTSGYSFERENLSGEDNEALAWLSERYPDPLDGMAALVCSASDFTYEDVVATQRALGVTLPDELIVVGGWSQNTAYTELLANAGFEVIVPSYAPEATMLGLAADCLFRTGQAESMEEAFAKLPEFS